MAAAQEAGLRVLRSREWTLNGEPAVTLIGDLESERGVVRTFAVFFRYAEQVFVFTGQSAPRWFPVVLPEFEQTVRSFVPLRDPQRLNIEPVRLRLVAVDAATPWRELVPSDLAEPWSAENLAILNQLDATDQIPAGRRVKLPE